MSKKRTLVASYPSMSELAPYYERNKEARKAYQKAYYTLKKAQIRRKRELDTELCPEKTLKVQEYQRNYYLTNRHKLIEKRRLRYLASQSVG